MIIISNDSQILVTEKNSNQIIVENTNNLIITPEQNLIVVREKESELNISNVGIQGLRGEQGLSAYEIAVLNGFVGSESDWLISLGNAKLKIQFALQLTVSITHNFNFNPQVSITDNNGYLFEGEVRHLNLNQLVVNFNNVRSGFILVN